MNSRYSSELPVVVTADQAAEMTGVASGRTFLRWARDGQIAHIKLPNGHVRFRREDIEEILKPTSKRDERLSEDGEHRADAGE